MDNRRNYYRILHVQPDAPTEIIRMSYLTLMQRLRMHPDLGGDHAQAALINEAFATLIDTDQRAAYDRTLARERAMPGYRSDPAHHHDQDRTPAASPRTSDPYACAFCGTAFPPRDGSRVDALCAFCASPLYPAARHEHAAATRRAISRVERQLPVTFFLSWPQHPGISARTEDISISGMRLVATLDLVPNERLKIDCDFCSAVAVVRHAHRTAGKDGLWTVGVEFLTLLIKPARGLLVSTRA
jgi:hypothetical protein